MVSSRDPEVSELTYDSLRLIARAERVVDDLNVQHEAVERLIKQTTNFVDRRQQLHEMRKAQGGRRVTDPE